MIIAIPTDETRKNVCVSFGRAPFFLFHNTDTGTTEFVENPAAEAQGGAGPKAAQVILDHDSDVLITVRCGENAARVLQMGEVKIMEAQGQYALENLQTFLDGKGKELTHFHAGFHHQ